MRPYICARSYLFENGLIVFKAALFVLQRSHLFRAVLFVFGSAAQAVRPLQYRSEVFPTNSNMPISIQKTRIHEMAKKGFPMGGNGWQQFGRSSFVAVSRANIVAERNYGTIEHLFLSFFLPF